MREQALNATERAGYGRGMRISRKLVAPACAVSFGDRVPPNQESGDRLDGLGGVDSHQYDVAFAAAGGRAFTFGALPAIYTKKKLSTDVSQNQNHRGHWPGELSRGGCSELAVSANLWEFTAGIGKHRLWRGGWFESKKTGLQRLQHNRGVRFG